MKMAMISSRSMEEISRSPIAASFVGAPILMEDGGSHGALSSQETKLPVRSFHDFSFFRLSEIGNFVL